MAEQAEPTWRMDRATRRVFIGLMLGMFVASISMTIVSPALPRIVAELGGMDHYSWLATSTMLVSAITVPIVGKLSDMYGRRPFYLGGLVLFMVGSALSGMATSFGFLIAARCLQGAGMGILQPLSQTIIGDVIPPRQRGKYQGWMGAVFGVSSVAGPIAGGWITDAFGWRPLFYAAIPFGIVAFFFIARFLHLPHQRVEGRVDLAGITTMTLSVVSLLLATSLGGSTLPWGSAWIIGLYVFGVVMLGLFIAVERRAEEPLIPLGLFRNQVFTLSTIASFLLAIAMFVVIIYVPVFAQGVLGVNATVSGLVMVPMNVAMIGVSIIVGILITRTGRYKEFTLVGLGLMGIGLWMVSLVGVDSAVWHLSVAIVVFGMGLGLSMQQYVLMVQNAVQRRDLGVATATTQFFRTIGQVVGIAVAGSIMNAGLARALPKYLPNVPVAGDLDAGAVLDPTVLAQLPAAVARAVRLALGEAMTPIFLWCVPLMVVALIVTLAIRNLPLRETVHSPEDQGREMLDAMSQSSADEERLPMGPPLGSSSRTGERLLGLQLAAFADMVDRPDRELVRRAVTELGDGDLERGLQRLRDAAGMLTTEDPAIAAAAEPSAVALSAKDHDHGVLSAGLRGELAAAAGGISGAGDRVACTEEPTVAERYQGVNVESLGRIGNELTAALMVDLYRDSQHGVQPVPGRDQ